jgi:hypothetical protein
VCEGRAQGAQRERLTGRVRDIVVVGETPTLQRRSGVRGELSTDKSLLFCVLGG